MKPLQTPYPPIKVLVTLALLLGCATTPLLAQTPMRYHRLYLSDKGTPARTLRPGDPLYASATAHLSPRALARRARVLPPDDIVTTADLPLVPGYLSDIAATGAQIVRTSRWMNTVMVFTDSATIEALRPLPFIDSVQTVKMRRSTIDPGAMPKPADLPSSAHLSGACITAQYGRSENQHLMMDVDDAHKKGFAGEGVFVGVLDAGFDWRTHVALSGARVVAEYDFVNNDSIPYDEPGEENYRPEEHGTNVMSLIGGFWPGMMVGGAPRVSFALAKTEDVRREIHVEEDHYVAGLEWLEAMGVDVTNTSLGYTTFDAPERSYSYAELDGHTAFSTRAVNHCVKMGVVCVVAAGNEAGRYNYVSVPAEADSAIAVAAVDLKGNVASFSSKGFRGRERLKPDVAALGVGNFVADPRINDSTAVRSGNGTSFASPTITAIVAILLSAAPELTPFEVRSILTGTANRTTTPDTSLGYGIVSADRALEELSRRRPIIGVPKVALQHDRLAVAAWISDRTAAAGPLAKHASLLELGTIALNVRHIASGHDTTVSIPQPSIGTARWLLPPRLGGTHLLPGDSIGLTFTRSVDGLVLRHSALRLTDDLATPTSFLCDDVMLPENTSATAVPNPFHSSTIIRFKIDDEEAPVSLAVYNALGQEVAMLYNNETLPSGYHSVLFDAEGLPAGAYYARLRVKDTRFDQPLIYVP